jgi:hypothetical protein
MNLKPIVRSLALGSILSLAAGLAAIPRQTAGRTSAPNTLSPEERAQGWTLLFDGTSFVGWRGLGYEGVPKGHWAIEDGAIRKIADRDVPPGPDGKPLPGGDLMTLATFRDFELAFEWKVAPGANSGVKYNVSEDLSRGTPPQGHAALGFEYQVLDDDLHEDARNGPNRTAAALYDLLGPIGKRLRPVGEYNDARIVLRGGRGEHWLNGRKVLEYDLGSADFAAFAGFAQKRDGHIVLQAHGDAVWFRSLKIRALK